MTNLDVTHGTRSVIEDLRMAERILDTVRDGLVVLDRESRVRSANQSFRHMFDASRDDIEGRLLAEVGGGAWDIPKLHARLNALRNGDAFDDFEVEKDIGAGVRTFVLHARFIEPTRFVLLSIDDVTERKLADKAMKRADALQKNVFDTTLAEERERRRIATLLHDRVGQSLALAQIKLTSLREQIANASRLAIDQAIQLITQCIGDTRDLTFELSPPVLHDLGLHAAISWLADDFKKRHDLDIDVSDDGRDKPLDDTTAAFVFRGVRELLLNVTKHSREKTAAVSLRRVGSDLDVTVRDEGEGFDVDDHGTATFGLFSVRDQMRRLGGAFDLVSKPGQGTRATLRIPLKST